MAYNVVGMVQRNGPVKTVSSGEAASTAYYYMEVFLPEIALEAKPGQFVQLRCGDGIDPFLRRPLSVAGVDRGQGLVRFLYQVKGEGTRWLADRQAGDRLDAIGPLGHGFNLRRGTEADQPDSNQPDQPYRAILVAGGIGVAPLLFLAQEMQLEGFCRKRAQLVRGSGEATLGPVALLGARTSGLLLGAQELEDMGCEVLVATEDGSAGYRGLVTEVLEQVLRDGYQTEIFACGPRPMLAVVAQLCHKYHRPGWVSLEERMACGLGACRGCAIKVRRQEDRTEAGHTGLGYTYVNVCSEGPVFSINDIIWQEVEAVAPGDRPPGLSPAASSSALLATGSPAVAGLVPRVEEPGASSPEPSLAVEIAGLKLKNPVMSASGTFGFGEEYEQFMDLNQLGAIVVKSVTLEPTVGNPPPRVCETPAGMLNSIAWQNPGLEVFLKEKLPFLRQFATPVIVNVAGRTVEEYAEVARRLDGVEGVAALEANISCPNVHEGGVAFGSDPDMAAQVTRAMRQASSLPLIVKLSPNVTDIALIARRAVEAGADALSLINALTAIAIDPETQRPILGNIIGGLTGPAIKPVALYMVWRVAQAVEVPIIGIGGIIKAADAVEFLLAGATAVAVGAGTFVNPRTIPEVIIGLKEYLRRHGLTDVCQLIGALRPPAGGL